jgi:S-adenosylmethionine-diacylglycerol 3-amino-3-carboxypropyl transferase
MRNAPSLQYGCCNEDARSELDALRVRGRRVISIAAAGERALALLLDDPREVVAIDRNPAQVYLGELKVAAMRELSRTEYLAFVGILEEADREAIYRALESNLSSPAQYYFRAHLDQIRAGIMHSGRTERGLQRVAPILRLALAHTVAKLRAAESLEAQGRLAREMLTRPLTRAVFALIFNPISGRLLLRDRVYYGDARRVASRYIAQRLVTTFEQHRLDDCFIFQLFLQGQLEEGPALPIALSEESYGIIKQRLNRVRFVIDDIRSFLAAQPAESFDAFSLSDLGGYLNVEEYSNLLEQVQRTATDRATVCIREFISEPTKHARWPDTLVRARALESKLDRSDRSVGCTFVCASKTIAESPS